MGQLTLDQVVTALRAAGFNTERGYPARKMAVLTEPAVAVNLQRLSRKEQTLTALVTIYSPAELGAVACEETALAAADVLTEQGGSCEVSACEFDGKAGLFSEKISATFLTAVPLVKLGETVLKYVEAFTCWRTVDEDAGITSLDGAPWNFRLEEFFPVDALEEEEPEEPFYLMHINENGSETFSECQWTYQRRVWSETGTRQIRLGTAQDMQNG